MESNLNNTLTGLLYINEVDAWTRYGVFLSEERAAESSNYSTLLALPSMKPHKAISYREEDGERLPSTLDCRFEARDMTLHMTLIAGSKEEFLSRHRAFIGLLKSGWLTLRLPELNRSYRIYYLSGGDYKQLTSLEGDLVAAQFSIRLREPQPQF